MPRGEPNFTDELRQLTEERRARWIRLVDDGGFLSERDTDRSRKVRDLAREILADIGASPTDDDLRFEMAYLGPEQGRCSYSVWVRRAILEDAADANRARQYLPS